MTISLKIFLALLLVAAICLIWTLNGGTPDGSQLVMFVSLGLAGLLALGTRIFNGAWFTDNANGR